MDWKGGERIRSCRGPLCLVSWKLGFKRIERYMYDLNGAIPRAGAECIFGDQIPMHGKGFALVLLPRLDREFIQGYIEQLDGAIATGHHDLVLVDFGPGKIVESILGFKPLFLFSSF